MIRSGRVMLRVVLHALVATLLIILAVAILQMALSDLRERSRAALALDELADRLSAPLEQALQEGSASRIREVLDAGITVPGVVFLRLTGPDAALWTRGTDPINRPLVRRAYPLHGDAPATVPVGLLTIGRAPEPDRLFSAPNVVRQIGVLLLPMLALWAVLILVVDRVLGRPLRQITGFAEGPWLREESGGATRRAARAIPDEFDRMAQVMDRARHLLDRADRERRRLLASLADLNKTLSDANQDQADFVYAVSHDLRAPTKTARMLLEQFREVAEAGLDKEAASILEDLDRSNARLGHLVEDLILYSRSIGKEVEKTDIKLDDLVHDVIRDLTSAIRDARAEVITRDLPVVHGAPVQIRAVLKSLLSNAIKFHDPSRGAMVEIWGGASSVEGLVQFSIRDNGIGIDPQHQERIFDLFTRLNGSDEDIGSGMGLSMCQRIVTEHGGRIEVISKPDAGSTFTAILPGRAQSSASGVHGVGGHGSRVLRLGLNTPPDGEWAIAARAFADELREASNGDLDVMVLPGRRLSKPDEILQQVQDGTLDMAVIPAAELANLVPEMGALFAPYLADDFAHAGRILRSEAARSLLSALEGQIDVIGAGFCLGGFRQIAVRGDLSAKRDLAGMKMRIPPVVPLLDFYEFLGVEPVPVPLQHSYQAFVSGRVDGMDMDGELLCKMGYLDHVDTVLWSNHIMFPGVGLVSKRVWRDVGESQRRLIGDLMAKHLDSTVETNAAEEIRHFEAIVAAGKVVREVGPEFFGETIEAWNRVWLHRTTTLGVLRELANDLRQ
ncbi:MAG: TRAP transporter substrate-binding protein DctP [Silicimonas sp.]|nr:TRAP transporter substrate-binding protein DctP [Silicimonas sp.]